MRASSDVDCQWFVSWLDDVVYRRGDYGPAPVPSAKFLEVMPRAIFAARAEMAAMADFWQPSPPAPPEQLMLPGDWPETPARRRRRRKPRQ
jgi:hypothetical protein